MTKELMKDVVQWDVASWSAVVKYWEENTDFKTLKTGLELGGREGGLSLWMAKNGTSVICSDLNNVESTASPLHQEYGVGDLVKYQDIDATNIPYKDYFDVIVFKSIIGGIGRNNDLAKQQAAFKSIHSALKPGGKLLFAENTVASPLHSFFRKRFVKWSDHWRYVSSAEMESFLKDFSSVELKYTGFLATFGRSEWQRELLAYKDRLFFNHLVPNSWKYICYGMAIK